MTSCVVIIILSNTVDQNFCIMTPKWEHD